MFRSQIDFPIEVKALTETGSFEAYGAIFGNVDAHNDIIEPGAFKETLKGWKKKESKPALLWQHDMREPAGVIDELKEDETGLWMKGRLALKTQRGAEAYELMHMKALTGMSIGYRPIDQDFDPKKGTRILKAVELWEVSLVTMPANDKARLIAIKSGDVITERDFERMLTRDAGFSRTEAHEIINHGFKSLVNKRDAVKEEDEPQEPIIGADVLKSMQALADSFKKTFS